MTVEHLSNNVNFIKFLYENKDMRGLKDAINTFEAIEVVHILEELSPEC